ncbi:hypothetical protein, partial [Pseudooctadecabacter sp.]|uniref:hypothetical protein n=1 Tax=Pseudooctadecabacter sp. TaxID=1966338 RepID=UPI0025D25933
WPQTIPLLRFAVRTTVSDDFFDSKDVICQHHAREQAGVQLAKLLPKRIDGAPIEACLWVEKATSSDFRV